MRNRPFCDGYHCSQSAGLASALDRSITPLWPQRCEVQLEMRQTQLSMKAHFCDGQGDRYTIH